MRLFKKKTNSTEKKINDKEEIEILDFSNETKTLNKKEKGKDFKIFIIIGIIIIAFVLLLPYIESLFISESSYNYSNNVDDVIKTKNTINGMLLIGEEDGYIKINNVQFYIFKKRGNNNISFSYKVDKKINNVNDLNYYVEIYNKNEILIYREKFIPYQMLEKDIYSYTLNLNSTFYGEAYYAKIVQIKKDDLQSDEKIICNRIFVDDIYSLNYSIEYLFSNNKLLQYNVEKMVTTAEDNLNENKYLLDFKEEQNGIINLGGTATLENQTLKYSIDFLNFNYDQRYDEIMYDFADTKRMIEFAETSKGWSCVNE